MNLKDLFKKEPTNWFEGHEKQYDVNKGKADLHAFGKIFIFVPIGVVLSSLAIIVAVIGAPTTMDFFRHGLDSIYGSGNIKPAPVENLFDDVSGDSKYFDSLSYLKKNGLISGFSDNTFRPEQNIKRSELIKTLITSKKQFPLALNYNNCFKDVKNEWYAPSTCLAKERGWIKGYDDNSFHPNDDVTRGEAIKMMTKTFDINDYPADLVGDLTGMDEPINRGDAFQMLYRVLQL